MQQHLVSIIVVGDIIQQHQVSVFVVGDIIQQHQVSVFVVGDIIQQHLVNIIVAGDLQLQMYAPPDRISELLHSIQSYISDVKDWATANMLKLNDNKTELMLVTSKRTKHLHNLPTSITIDNAQIPST